MKPKIEKSKTAFVESNNCYGVNRKQQKTKDKNLFIKVLAFLLKLAAKRKPCIV